jgi:hypothetical protein
MHQRDDRERFGELGQTKVYSVGKAKAEEGILRGNSLEVGSLQEVKGPLGS